MAIEDKNNTDLIRGKGKQSSTKDLIRGTSDPTIETYQTKGFNHEGVSGSTPVTRLNETNIGIAITPEVMIQNGSPLEKQVKDDVKGAATGSGMPADSGKVKK